MKASTLDLETWFLEVFTHILNLPKYEYSAFCQRISQLHKVVTYVLKKKTRLLNEPSSSNEYKPAERVRV